MKFLKALALLSSSYFFRFATAGEYIEIEDSNQRHARVLGTSTADISWEQVGGDILPKYGDNGLEGLGCGGAVDISPDGKYVLVGCPGSNNATGSVHLFELKHEQNTAPQWKEIQERLLGKEQGNNNLGESVSLALSKDKNITAAIGEPGFDNGRGRVRIIDNFQSQNPASRQPFEKGNNMTDFFGSFVELSNNGNRIAVKSSSTEVKILDYNETHNKWDEVFTIPSNNSIVDLSVSRDRLAFTTNETTGVLYDITGNNTPALVVKIPDANAVSLSVNGRVLATGNKYADCNGGSACGSVKILRTGGPNNRFRGGPGDECGSSLDVSQDGNRIVIGCKDKVLIFTWRPNEQKEWDRQTIDDVTNVQSVVISDDGESVVIGSDRTTRRRLGRNLQTKNTGAVRVLQRSLQPSTPSPPSLQPASVTSQPSSQSSKGKGKKKSKGSKKKKSKKCKGSKKSKGKSKKSPKKSKGKSSKKSKCNTCEVPDGAEEQKTSFDIKANGDLEEEDLNEVLCNVDCTSQGRKLSTKDNEIYGIEVTELTKAKEDCKEKCDFKVEGTLFYKGFGGKEDGVPKKRINEFIKKKLDGQSGIGVGASDSISLTQSEAAAGADNNPIVLASIVLLIVVVAVVAAGLFAYRNERDSHRFHKQVNSIDSSDNIECYSSPLPKQLDTAAAELSFLKEFLKENDELPVASALPLSSSSREHCGQSNGALRPSSLDGASRKQRKTYEPTGSSSPTTDPSFPISAPSNSSDPFDPFDLLVMDERSNVELNEFFPVARHPSKVDGQLGGQSLSHSEVNNNERSDDRVVTSVPSDEY